MPAFSSSDDSEEILHQYIPAVRSYLSVVTMPSYLTPVYTCVCAIRTGRKLQTRDSLTMNNIDRSKFLISETFTQNELYEKLAKSKFACSNRPKNTERV